VSTTVRPPEAPAPVPPEERGFFTLFAQRSGGVVTALITTLLAFLVGGLVVLATGSNPLSTYRGIFNGTGLNWFFPWVSGLDRELAGYNLQQTLIVSTTLALTGLAVAFAFRCGLFNIGGQGQWTVGAITAVWVGSSWGDMAGGLHIVIAIVLATLVGALFAGIAGLLKAWRGTHEVISTIMLNWIAYWVGSYAFGLGGPLQNDADESVPVSNDVQEDARLPILWGEADLQGLHIGFLIALGVLVAYWLILSRTTLGFRVRAVGRNPEAARYGGISVGWSYFLAMAISGAFAGLAGALDILGWQYRLGVLDVQFSQVGFIGIAVALLGRNTAVGVAAAALLFGALLYGTSTRSLDPTVFDPALAGNLTTMIQALVLLFIGADVLILALWRRRRLGLGMPRLPRFVRRRSRPTEVVEDPVVSPTRRDYEVVAPEPLAVRLRGWARARVPRGAHAVGIGAVAVGLFAGLVSLPPFMNRSPVVPVLIGLVALGLGAWTVRAGRAKLGYWGIALAVAGAAGGVLATNSSEANLETVFVWSALTASMLRYATPLIFAALGGMFSERSGVVNIGLEGMLLMGAFFGLLGSDAFGHWTWGILSALVAGALIALVHAVVSVHFRADQIVSGVGVNFLALGLTGYLFIDVYGSEGTPPGIPAIPDVRLGFLDGVPYLGDAIGQLNLMVWLALLALPVCYVIVFRTPFGLRLRSVGEHPRAADTVGLSVYRIRYTAVIISGMLAALGGAFLSIGFVNSFSENMTAGAGFIALAALIFGNWRPPGLFAAALLFGFSSALAQRLPVYSDSAAVLFQTLPYVLTLVAVAGIIGRPRPPAAIGIPYVKK
jgi:ABC-type uncharacterized transport system permease subunit